MATTSNLPVTAALLLGGRSRRMGQDKAMLEVEGRVLWKRQIEVLEQVGAEEVVISAAPSRVGMPADYPVIVDEVEEQGPLRAIATLLRRCPTGGLLVLGVDLPAVTPEFLRELAITGIAEDLALVPDDGERLQPLVAFYTKRCLPLADEQLAGGSFALHRFVEGAITTGLARRLAVEPQQRSLFENLNTPEDVAAFVRRAAR